MWSQREIVCALSGSHRDVCNINGRLCPVLAWLEASKAPKYKDCTHMVVLCMTISTSCLCHACSNPDSAAPGQNQILTQKQVF